MIAALVLLMLVQTPAEKPAAPERIENGRWAERGEDGSSGCGDPQARDIDIYYLMTPPHPRSPNTGEISFGLGPASGTYILTSVPQLSTPDEGGNWQLSLTGGIVHTVGVERDGVLSSFTRGAMDAEFSLGTDGDLRLQTLVFAERGREAEILVADRRIAETGEALQAFEFCEDAA